MHAGRGGVPSGLAAVAFENALGYEPDPQLGAQPEPSNADIELWEIHSELALVRRGARASCCLSATQTRSWTDPAPNSPSSTSADEAFYPESLSLAVLGYTLSRLAETERTALLALVAVVALTLLAQLVP